MTSASFFNVDIETLYTFKGLQSFLRTGAKCVSDRDFVYPCPTTVEGVKYGKKSDKMNASYLRKKE